MTILPVTRAEMHDDFDGETKYQEERELEKKKEKETHNGDRESAPDALWGNSKNRQKRAANFAQLCMTASVKHAICFVFSKGVAVQLCIYFVRVVPPVSHFTISQPVSYRGTGTSQDKRADMSRGVATTAGACGRTPRGTSMGREKSFL